MPEPAGAHRAGRPLAAWRREAARLGFPRAHFDAFCRRRCGMGNRELYAADGLAPAPGVAWMLEGALRLAADGWPPELICGEAEFMGRRVRVERGAALLPREESQVLVSAVAQLPLGAAARVLELGVGSGALCAALARLQPGWSLAGLDASAAALRTAKANLPGSVALLRGDWAAALRPGCVDAAFCNPPYVESAWLRTHPELALEPRLALDGGADGLDAYRALLPGACAALRPGGWLALEHGRGQAGPVAQLLPQGMEHAGLRRDAAGVARVLLARKRSPKGAA